MSKRTKKTKPKAATSAKGGKRKGKGAKAPKSAEQESKTKKDAKPKRLSALDAAAQVLQKAGEPMNCKALITAMAEQGLWTSPAGKSPASTLYSAMLRETQKKGASSRFRKVERGLFAFND